MTTNNKPVYKNPKVGSPLISTISSGCKTPILEIKFCNLVKPFYYPNSPTIPRYSITCLVDPVKHKEFLTGIQTIEKNEKVETIIKIDSVKEEGAHLTTGKVLIKFQSKDKIPVHLVLESDRYALEGKSQIDLEDELAKGSKIQVVYDILRYTKKNTMHTEHGLSFKPTAIYFHSDFPLTMD